MKLRNKKTGEIVPASNIAVGIGNDGKWYETLAELNEEWEDYEESTTYYYISDFGAIREGDVGKYVEDEIVRKGIGNYFETKEEAKKAVEKLKAWKRLKDKGFRFTGVAGISNNIYVSFETDSEYRGGHVMYDKYSNTDNNLREYNEDLMLLFGGEE